MRWLEHRGPHMGSPKHNHNSHLDRTAQHPEGNQTGESFPKIFCHGTAASLHALIRNLGSQQRVRCSNGNWYVYIGIYVPMYTCTFVFMYLCMYLCIYVCAYICTYVYIYMYICTFADAHMYMCVNMCIYVYTYVCKYLHMSTCICI